MEKLFTNELVNESSPYLLQHAHNPVQWHAWSETALEKAKKADKPILVSIGYSACHWCHVMERESFENVEVAAYMNEHFVNIKIDREERPDLDHIYMEAVQAISGSGGWPLNVFLTTDAKPFYGGTYFPPEKAFNRASWKDVLAYMVDAWKNKRDEVEKQAETLSEHINSSSQFISKNALQVNTETKDYFTQEHCKLIAENILKNADPMKGGFGTAPKFPQTFSIQYLLGYGHLFKDEKALRHAEFSLQQLINGGIYDQLAGGMARYSTDDAWLAPHFEKMLYDNALLVSVLADAYQITGNEFYKNAIERTLNFFISDMQHPGGGFYAALDADSEGVEGKFYVWDKEEIDQLLGTDSKIFCDWFGVKSGGNWEGVNILHVSNTAEDFASENSITTDRLNEVIESGVKRLLEIRNKRIPPATDDKILVGWNALLLTALCKASAALTNPDYKQQAIILFDFLYEKFSKNGMLLYHTYKNGLAKHPAYLDDYAYMIQSCIFLQELTSNQEYLVKAEQLAFFVIKNFKDEETGFFFYTGVNQKDIIVRKTEIYDNAVPSGNSIMAENLFYLSVVFDNRDWWLMANKMLISLSEIIFRHPNSFGIWANLIFKQWLGLSEIVVTGNHAEGLLSEVLKLYLPARLLQSSVVEKNFPLLQNKIYGDEPLIYLCKNYSCLPPVGDFNEFKILLEK